MANGKDDNSGHNDAIEIICEDPVPRAIEDALRRYLGRYPGTWRIRINLRLTGGWWSVTVASEGFHRIFLLSPQERTANHVMAQLRQALNPGAPPPAPWDGRERRAHPRR
jgi:hypothetical protein